MSKQTIWTFFKRNTDLSDEAIAGIMGNMEAESNCEAMRVQGDFSYNRQMSQHYADMVNSGTMAAETFANDARGWGLCQWTFNSRKLNLLKSCQSAGKGIENEQAQLEFFLVEIQNEYPATWKSLLATQDIYQAAFLVCHNYERPAVENTAQRAAFGETIYKEFHASQPTQPEENNGWIVDGIEYWESIKADIQAKIDDLNRRLS